MFVDRSQGSAFDPALETLLIEGLERGPDIAVNQEFWETLQAQSKRLVLAKTGVRPIKVAYHSQFRSPTPGTVIRRLGRMDILKQFLRLLDENAVSAGNQFIEAVAATVSTLPKVPTMTVRVRRDLRLSNLRKWPVEGFERIRIYYVARGEGVRILRVLEPVKQA